jgi:hypothetical protein
VFASSWLWAQNQLANASAWVSNQLAPDPADDIDTNEFYLLPVTSLRALRQTTHSVPHKTYYFINTPRGDLQLYCVEEGTNKPARNIKLTQEVITELAAIDPKLKTQVEVKTKLADLIVSDLPGPTTKLELIRYVIEQHDNFTLEMVDKDEFNSKQFFKHITKDSYFLVNTNNTSYELYYYNADKKTNTPLLAYDNTNQTYDSLPELMQDAEDKTLFEDISISEEGLDGFAKLLQDNLKNEQGLTHETIGEMQDYLNYYHEKLPSPDIYQNAKKIVAQIQKHTDTMLENNLDPYYFKKYFRSDSKDATGRYTLPEKTNDNEKIIKYMTFHNMLVDMEIFLEKTSKLHLHVIQPFSMYNTIINSPVIHESFTAWLSSYNELYASGEPLGAMTLLRNVCSPAGITHELQKLIPFNPDFVTQQFTTNPFYLSHMSQQQQWNTIVKGTDNKIDALQKILNDFSKNLPQGGQANENIQVSITHINNILMDLNINEPPRSLLAVLKFVYDVYPKVTALIKTLPKSAESLQAVFKEHLLTTAQQINLIFRDVVLHFDQFEIEYHLKAGTLLNYQFAENTSLKTLLESFNNAIEKTGYEFKPEERYPYAIALLEQRKLMLSYPNTPKELVIARIKLATQALPDVNTREVAIQEHAREHLKQATTLINERIVDLTVTTSNWVVVQNIVQRALNVVKKGAELLYPDTAYRTIQHYSEEIPQWFSSGSARVKKIALLSQLRNQIEKTQSFDAALQALSADETFVSNQRKLLWTGKTGKILREIQSQIEATPQELVTKIQLETNRLIQSRDQRILLFAKSKRQANERQILALERLQQMMIKPGINITNALKKLKATNPLEYQTLTKHNTAFISELELASQRIPADTSGKKLIDFIESADAQLQFSSRAAQLKRNFFENEIDKRIHQLNRELTHTLFTPGIKRQKIDLLKELQTQLKQRPLAAALENIASNKVFKESFYLLREGRTGLLINDLEQSAVSPSEKSNYVELAIQKLKKARSQDYTLFSEQEHFIEDRIAALAKLKEQLVNDPNISFDDVLKNLSSEQQHLLLEYEQTLIKKIQRWEVVNKMEQDYIFTPGVDPSTPNDDGPVLENNEADDTQEIQETVIPPTSPTLSAGEEYAIFYQSIIDNIKSFEETTHKSFKSLLNPSIHRVYFDTPAQDEQGRYIININTDEPKQVQDYKKFFNMLINTRLFVEKLNELHTPIVDYTATDNYSGLATNSPALFSALKETVSAYQDLYYDVDEMEIFSFIGKLSTATGAQQQLMAFMPPGAVDQASEFSSNPVFQAFTKHERVFFGTLDLNQKLDHIQMTLLNFDTELPTNEIARESTKKTIKDVLKVINETRKFAKSPCELFDALKLVYNIYPSVNSLINNSGQTYSTLNEAIKEQLIQIIQQLNFIMLDIMLGIDRFKLTHFLADTPPNEILSYEFKKDLSIDKVLAQVNTWIESTGYEFKADERYPYPSAILEQRKSMQLEQELPAVYLKQAITTQENKITANTMASHKTVDSDIAASNKRVSLAITTVIDKRIAELTKEKQRWLNFTKTKDVKIQLLTKLKAELSTNSLPAALQRLKNDPTTSNSFHYLESGRTGLLLLEITQAHTNPKAMITLVTDEITRTTRASYNTYSQQTKKDLQKSIMALQRLNHTLAKPGFRLVDALAQISAKYPEDYALLLDKQQSLIDKITRIDSHIDDYRIGKKIIGKTEEFKAPTADNSTSIKPRVQAEIAYLLLDHKTKPALFKNKSKDVKAHVALLERLMAAVNDDPQFSTKSFVDSLTVQERKLIKQHDKLIQDIGEWQQTHTATTPSIKNKL